MIVKLSSVMEHVFIRINKIVKIVNTYNLNRVLHFSGKCFVTIDVLTSISRGSVQMTRPRFYVKKSFSCQKYIRKFGNN